MRFLLTLVYCCISLIGFAQQDFQLWTGIELQKKLMRRTNLSVELENRNYNNALFRKSTFANIGISRKLNDLVDISLGYRISNSRVHYGFYNTRHRFDFNFYISSDIDRLGLQYRVRIQSGFSGILSTDDGFVSSNYLRHRFKAKYDMKGTFKKLTPDIRLELFQPVNYQSLRYIDGYRIQMTLDYRIKKRRNLKVFYLFENQYNRNSTTQISVAGIQFSYEFKN